MRQMSDTHTPSQPSGITLFRRLWREHVVQFWPLMVVAVVLMSVEGAALGAFAWLIQPLFDQMFAAGSMDGVGWIAFAISGVFILRAVAGFLQRLIIVSIGLRVTTALQNRLLGHLLSLDVHFFQENAPGALIDRVRGDTAALQGAASTAVMSLGRDTITLIALLTVMFVSDWQWTFLALVGIPLLILPMLALQRLIYNTSRAARQGSARISTRLDEIFHGITAIKVNRLEAHEHGRFTREADGLLRNSLRTMKGQAGNPAMIDIIAAVGFIAVLYFGGAQIVDGDKTTGQFMSFFTALALMFDPLRRLANIAGQLQAAFASLERLYWVLEVSPTILPPTTPQPLTPGDVVFDNVHFGYGTGPVLRGLTFTARAGQTTALVGPSGAGKSTVFSLLTRLIDPDSGALRINDTATTDADLGALRDMIALVGQDTALFDETIAQNIRLGRLDASDADIRAAAEAASVTQFTDTLPDALDTVVGPRGGSLSGGQRQRVAIARAMLKSAPILLLDEPTSALDAESERLVQEALTRLSEGRTTIVIAHRLSTIRDADMIIVIDQGRVIEQGNHADLMAADGAYARLNALQAAGLTPQL